jgi:hypothetical protein
MRVWREMAATMSRGENSTRRQGMRMLVPSE